VKGEVHTARPFRRVMGHQLMAEEARRKRWLTRTSAYYSALRNVVNAGPSFLSPARRALYASVRLATFVDSRFLCTH
jgi:hypothetical protein